jgi:hypothetical protein
LPSLENLTTLKKIGQIFEISPESIDSRIKDKGWTHQRESRPSYLSDNDSSLIRKCFNNQFLEGNRSSYSDVTDFPENILGKIFPIETIRKHIKKLKDFKIIKGIPFDLARLQCDQAEIDNYYKRLEDLLHDFPAEMVINTRKNQVIVRGVYEKKFVHIPGSRSTKRKTLLGQSMLTVCG